MTLKRRFFALLLVLALMLTVFTVPAFADDGEGSDAAPVSFAFDRDDPENRCYDGDTIYLPSNGELYIGFDRDPYDGLIPGWRNDLLEQQGFDIDPDPAFFEGDGYAYAHVRPGEVKPGESGTLTYSWYRPEDIFGDDAPGWQDAEPVSTHTLRIEVYRVNMVGDSDGDGSLSILDATTIQRVLAGLEVDQIVLLSSDSDRDGKITILDATVIQRYLADIDSPSQASIGEEVSYGTYYGIWNIEQELLPADSTLTGAAAERAREEIRQALSLLIDRAAIAGGLLVDFEGNPMQKTPANTFIPKWMTDADGSDFNESAGEGGGQGYYSVDPADYESNVAAAIGILKKYYPYNEENGKFTGFPVLTYIHNNGQGHALIADEISRDFGFVGITLNVEAKEWDTYYDVIASGEFSIARNGWIADDDSPLSFLTGWRSDSDENYVGFGKGSYQDAGIYSLDLTPYGLDTKVENGTWAQTYDVLLDVIDAAADTQTQYALMHLAEDMLMSTGCLLPLYYY